MVKTAVLVSAGGTNLQAILDGILFEEIKNCSVEAVISSDPHAYALTRAENAGIAAHVIDSSIFPTERSYNEALYNQLRSLDTELVVLAGYLPPLDNQVLEPYAGRIINTVPLLLSPFSSCELTGLDIHRALIEGGARVTGATACFVSDAGNSGPIIAQKAIEIRADDTADSLQRRVMRDCEWPLLAESVHLFCTGRLSLSDGGKVAVSSAERE